MGSIRVSSDICSECAAPVVGRRPNARFCSAPCKKQFDRKAAAQRWKEARARGALRPCAQCQGPIQRLDPRSVFCSRVCKDRAHDLRRQRATPPCRQCGETTDRRSNARYCSAACAGSWVSDKHKARVLEAKADRPPCRGCGGAVPPGRSSKALYCSDRCKIRSRRHETYGLSKNGLEALLAQHGRCAICDSSGWGRMGPQVDHCHDTGKVRGILCVNCNNGLGRFGDSPARLRTAALYLET